ncbi:MAG: hypothetical protein ACJA2G_001600 [Cognaticolwellia sp.]
MNFYDENQSALKALSETSLLAKNSYILVGRYQGIGNKVFHKNSANLA